MDQHGIMEHRGTTRQFYEIAYGDSTFVAVGHRGRLISIQAIMELHGTSGTTSETSNYYGVANGNNTFIAVWNQYKILKSTDNGSNWTTITHCSIL